MPTPPGPEIPPFTAQELDDFESDCVREDPAGVRMHRLCALARRGLEADKWKAAADMAFAGERARSADLDAAKREIAELNQRLYRLAGRALRHEHHAATGRLPTEWIDVVLDGPPGHESGRFVEVEDQHGHSISAGRWVPEGEFWRLRFTADDFRPQPRVAEYTPTPNDLTTWSMNGLMMQLDACRAKLRCEEHDTVRTTIEQKIDGIIAELDRRNSTGQQPDRKTHPVENWAEVTRQLGDRVARLEAERKLLERCRPVLEKALADLATEPGWSDRPSSGIAVGTLERVAKALGCEAPSPDELVIAAGRAAQLVAQREADAQEYAHTVDGMRADLLETQRQLVSERADNATIRSTREALAHRVEEFERQIRDIGTAHWKGVELYRDSGGSVPDSLPPVRALLVQWLLARLSAAHANLDSSTRGWDAGRKELLAKIEEFEIRVTDQAATIERLQKTEERTLAQKVADAEIKTLQHERDKLKRDVEMAQHDREQAEQDAEAGSTLINRVQKTNHEVTGQRDAALAALASIAYMLHVDRGESVGQTRDRIVAKLDGLVAKLALVREALGATLQPDGTDDVVDKARNREQVQAARDHDLDLYNIANRLGIVMPETTTSACEAIMDAIDKSSDALKTERKVHAQNRQLLAESNADHNALLTQLHRIREVFGIDVGMPWQTVADQTGKLQHDLAMARYDLEQATAQCDVLRGRQHEWFHVVEAITTRLGMTEVPGAPKEAREAIWSAIAKLQDASKPGLITAAVSAGPDPGRFAADLAAELGHRDVKLASGLAPFPELPVRPWGSIAEQILRDVIDSACACAAVPAVTFEIKHRRADADHPPRVELHVHRKGMESEPHVLAYVELGELWLVTADGQGGVDGFSRASHILRDWRWAERVHGALDRK